MRVTTIDGGFRGRPNLRALQGGRGLGILSTSQQNTEAEGFNARFSKFERARDLLRVAMQQGALPVPTAAMLETQFLAMGVERDAHRARLATLQNDADLLEWRSTADAIVSRANALADRAGALLGDEQSVRPWQIAVTLVGGALLFGGVAYAVSRMK